MQGIPRVRIAALIDFLLASGYLQVTGEYRGLTVSKTGLQVLHGDIKVMQREATLVSDDRITAESPLTQEDLNEDEQQLFKRLREWRLALSKKTEVPSFIIFNDRTLVALARQKPTTMAELLTVSGIGQAKADKYGQEVLQVITKVK
jgi:ATP-dependent DNA helicase RecQ